MNVAIDMRKTDAVRAYLVARRQELRQRLERLSADQRREAEPLSADAPDRVSQTENDEVVDRIGSAAHAELGRVDEALWRLDTGRYGICESCEHPIEAIRLAAVPYATRCVCCSSEAAYCDASSRKEEIS